MSATDPSGHCPMCITAAVGAVIGAGFSYGWQVAANVSANGLTADAFTNVSLSDIGKAALMGAVVGGTGGLGAAYLGTSMAANAFSGVMAGQAGVVASNLLEGETYNAGMGDPGQMALDGALGAVVTVIKGANSVIENSGNIATVSGIVAAGCTAFAIAPCAIVAGKISAAAATASLVKTGAEVVEGTATEEDLIVNMTGWTMDGMGMPGLAKWVMFTEHGMKAKKQEIRRMLATKGDARNHDEIT